MQSRHDSDWVIKKDLEMKQGHETYREKEDKWKREENLPSIGTGNQDSMLLWTKCNHGTRILWNSKLCKWPLWTEVLGQDPCNTHPTKVCHISPNSLKWIPTILQSLSCSFKPSWARDMLHTQLRSATSALIVWNGAPQYCNFSVASSNLVVLEICYSIIIVCTHHACATTNI